MSVQRMSGTRCQVCKKQFQIMKRCTKCRSVFYCSRDCQVQDWPQHKIICCTNTKLGSAAEPPFSKNDNSIFTEEEDNSKQGQKSPIRKIHPPLVDFSKATKSSAAQPQTLVSMSKDSPMYLHNNEIKTDIPQLDESQPVYNINVRCNKEKHKVAIQTTWTGQEVYKYLSHKLKVPLEKVKLIHKGRVLSIETVTDTLAEKALYQVIGEQALNEDGLDQRDINVLMAQGGVDRNQAVQTLRKKGDLIDALLDQ